MTTTTTTTTEVQPNYPYLVGSLKSDMIFLSDHLLAAGVITRDQIKAVNEVTSSLYEDAYRDAIAVEKKRIERQEAFVQK
jgi:hypothetical protein